MNLYLIFRSRLTSITGLNRTCWKIAALKRERSDDERIGLMNPLNRVLVPCRTGNSATMEDESQSLLRRWSICNVPGKRLATIDESLVPGQTPADEQPIGEDDQCDDVETSPNDTGIGQVEEETGESTSNVEANNGGAGSA